MSFQRLSAGVEGKSLSYMLSSCVCLSHAGIVSKWLEESSWFSAWRLIPPILHCVIRKFEYLQKLGYFHRQLCPNSGLEKFAMAIRSRCQQYSSSSSSTVDDTYTVYDNRRVVAVYYKSVNCNPLTHLTRFVVHMVYDFFVQLTRFWLTYRVARSVCVSRASCILDMWTT